MAAGCVIPFLEQVRNNMRAQAQVLRFTVRFTRAGDCCFLFKNLELRKEKIHEQDAHYGGVFVTMAILMHAVNMPGNAA